MDPQTSQNKDNRAPKRLLWKLCLIIYLGTVNCNDKDLITYQMNNGGHVLLSIMTCNELKEREAMYARCKAAVMVGWETWQRKLGSRIVQRLGRHHKI